MFLTMDRGVEFQQNIQNLLIGVMVIRAPSNRFEDLQPLIPDMKAAMRTIQPGQVSLVGSR